MRLQRQSIGSVATNALPYRMGKTSYGRNKTVRQPLMVSSLTQSHGPRSPSGGCHAASDPCPYCCMEQSPPHCPPHYAARQTPSPASSPVTGGTRGSI